jgi:hypothetical protein
MSTKKPIRALSDLDWVDWVCPCGSTFQTGGDNNRAFDAWLSTHYDHSDGTYIDQCTDRGATVWTTRPSPVCRKLTRPEKKP